MLQNFIFVGVGGAIGAICRYGLYKLFPGAESFIVTLVINIIGSLIIGLVLGYTATQTNSSENIKLLVATGICGGFTTFSAFSAENMQLLSEQKYLIALLYCSLSIVLGIAACFAGYKFTT